MDERIQLLRYSKLQQCAALAIRSLLGLAPDRHHAHVQVDIWSRAAVEESLGADGAEIIPELLD